MGESEFKLLIDIFFMGLLLFGNILWLNIESEFHRPGYKKFSFISPLSKWIRVQILNLSSYKHIILIPRCDWCIRTTGVEYR